MSSAIWRFATRCRGRSQPSDRDADQGADGSSLAAADSEASFAAAIAGVGQLLGDDRYLGDWGWDDAIALAEGNRGEDRFGYRAEAVRLMRLARDLSER